jgi:hypothetical protein
MEAKANERGRQLASLVKLHGKELEAVLADVEEPQREAVTRAVANCLECLNEWERGSPAKAAECLHNESPDCLVAKVTELRGGGA